LLLGIMHKTGAGVAANAQYAAQLFERACQSGESLACVSLGFMYANGEGVNRDEARAQQLFRTACAQQDPIGCQASSRLAKQQPVP
jgi:TPR repeat protein